MYPILFKIGPLRVTTYGFLLALAILLATWLISRRAKEVGYTSDNIIDLVFFIILGVVIGARLFFVFVYEPKYYFNNPLKIFALWEGGLVFYGGFIGAFLAAWWYIKRNSWDFWKLADLFAPYVAMGYGIGRLGCFFNGCCYGKITSKWGLIFPDVDNFYRYPTQIYESLMGFALFLFLLWWQKRKKFTGQVFLLFILLYSIGRGLVETFRDNLKVFGPITVAQLVSFLIFVIALIVYIQRRKKE